MPARVRCGPREQRERDRGDELVYFYHKSQQLGSAHSIFSKAQGGAAANLIGKAAFAQIEFAMDSPLEGGGFEPSVPRRKGLARAQAVPAGYSRECGALKIAVLRFGRP